MTLLLELVLTFVAGDNVGLLGFKLSVLVLSFTAFVLDSAELLLVLAVSVRFGSLLDLEAAGSAVSVGNGLLGRSVFVDDAALQLLAEGETICIVSHCDVEFYSVISPGDGVLINSDLKVLGPGSQKLEESPPVGVGGASLEQGEPGEDILVDSEVCRDSPVDVGEAARVSVRSYAVAQASPEVRFSRGLVSISSCVPVSRTIVVGHDVVISGNISVGKICVALRTLVHKHTDGLLAVRVGFVQADGRIVVAGL